MAKLTFILTHTPEENKNHPPGSDGHYNDLYMTFEVGKGGHVHDYLRHYAAFMYANFGYSIKELEELYQS